MKQETRPRLDCLICIRWYLPQCHDQVSRNSFCLAKPLPDVDCRLVSFRCPGLYGQVTNNVVNHYVTSSDFVNPGFVNLTVTLDRNPASIHYCVKANS